MSKLIILLWILCFINFGCSFDKYGFVVNGVKAKPGTYEYSAILALMCNKQYYICGGSIINQRFILTAGHCLHGCKVNDIAIRVGNVKTKLAHIVACQKYRIHKHFKGDVVPANMGNDIAIVLTGEDFMYGPTIKRVALTKHPPAVKYGYVAGWGIVAEGKDIPETQLRFAKQQILDKKTCTNILRRRYPGTICAKPPKKSKIKRYPALGDSGSALIVKGFIQIGIVSYRETTRDKTLIVYTYIPYFLNWVENTSRKLYCRRKPV